MKRNLTAIPIFLLGIALAGMGVPTAAQTEQTIHLGLGSDKDGFWDGDYVDTTTVPPTGENSYEYQLVTADGADRLRVALDLVRDYRRCTEPTDTPAGQNLPADCAHASPGTSPGTVHPSESSLPKNTSFKLEVFDDQSGQLPLIQPPLIDRTTELTRYSMEVFLCFNTNKDCDQDDPNAGDSSRTSAVELPQDSGGTWKIRVTPKPGDGGEAEGWSFRLRAKLEKAPELPDTNQRLLPNLRAIVPYELTFCEPAISGVAVATGQICGSDNSNGLTEDEEADQGGSVARALRFSTGLFNSGDGPWEVRGRTSGVNPETGNPTAPAIQRIYKRDGTFEEHNTNSNLEFHQGHGHWHTSIATYELFEVPAPDPSSPCPSGALNKKKLIEKSVGEKVGFCTADQGLFDWGRFYQARRDRWNDERCREDSENSDPAESAERFYTCGGSNCLSPTRPVIGLSVGWGDTYAWARLEQFVGFPENDHHQPKPGCYLLRATFDKKVDQSGIGKFEESNEDDNTSFAYFQVDPPSLDPKNSSKISIIRSGHGVGP